MHRISSDSEFLDSGKIVIDADGIPIEPVSKQSFEDALEPKADKSYVDSAVAPKADKSYVDSSLVHKADKSYVDSLAPVRSFLGTGSPEGKVTAPVGSVYTDSAATNGAIRWVKTSGAGNTGWRVAYGDTGWRNISSLLSNGWGGSVYVRRINDSVELRVEGLARSDTSNTIMTFPTGFLPSLVASHGLRFNLQQADPTASQTRFRIVSNIFSTFNSPTVPGPYYGGYTWTGSEAWPTTLPGTPT